jgi:squalene-associated FAD-dependent desaturase
VNTEENAAMRGRRVAIIGGGLAGLAAAAAAVECGLEVELFEARRRLGGRAGSFVDPQSGELVDHCQHVAMACCTNWADFCRRTEIADCFERHATLHFIAPDGRQCDFAPARWLPAPLHLLPALLRLRFLSFAERCGIARAVLRLAGEQGLTAKRCQEPFPAERLAAMENRSPEKVPDTVSQGTIGKWLRDQGQSDRAVQWFWAPILTSALGESLDRASVAAARQVFRDGFLSHRRAYELQIPRVPLGEIYDRRLAEWLAGHGVAIHRASRVARLEGTADRAAALVLADNTRREFDYVVAAVPWHRVKSLLPAAMLDHIPRLEGVERISPAPITAVHLWFDRPIMALPHAVLVGRLGQWVFNRTEETIPYYQVVISASHGLKGKRREEIVAEVRRELGKIWPAARDAKLLRWRVITEPAAVFAMRPGIERLRPAQRTPIANLALAGDWTDTGWPATMEGAVRSGYLAVEAILAAEGEPRQIVVPGLVPGGLARWLLTGG